MKGQGSETGALWCSSTQDPPPLQMLRWSFSPVQLKVESLRRHGNGRLGRPPPIPTPLVVSGQHVRPD